MVMHEPEPGWANLADCGNFPCTGPKNTLFLFTDTKYKGITPIPEKTKNFSIIPDVKDFSKKFDNCVKKDAWNAYLCQNDKLGILLFESEDDDSLDRSMQPIFLQFTSDNTIQNKVNSFMDHGWDGFYSS